MPITHDQWKLGTFILGLSWLFWGALTFDYPDWDVKLSLLMAGSTYLSAEQFIQSTKRPSWALVGWVVAAWRSIDGSYWLYWSLVDSSVMIREGQWLMSACLYLLCGLIWAAWPVETHPKAHPQYQQSLL